MSGRLPIHVHTKNTPTTEPGGVDLRMKTLPELLKEAETPWSTHYVGKWHAGGYLEGQTPANRGFDTAFGYLNGMEVRGRWECRRACRLCPHYVLEARRPGRRQRRAWQARACPPPP